MDGRVRSWKCETASATAEGAADAPLRLNAIAQGHREKATALTQFVIREHRPRMRHPKMDTACACQHCILQSKPSNIRKCIYANALERRILLQLCLTAYRTPPGTSVQAMSTAQCLSRTLVCVCLCKLMARRYMRDFHTSRRACLFHISFAL